MKPSDIAAEKPVAGSAGRRDGLEVASLPAATLCPRDKWLADIARAFFSAWRRSLADCARRLARRRDDDTYTLRRRIVAKTC